METRKIAIACQGGGIHGAFTCGVLDAILQAKEDEEAGRSAPDVRRRFEIAGLSGTSAGALNAFMVWYGMMSKDGRPGSVAEARQAVNHLWDTFQVQKRGEQGMNWLAQYFYQLAELGVVVKQPNPGDFNDRMASGLKQWSNLERLIAPTMDAGEIRPEFYDFMSLLRFCAPAFPRLQGEGLDEIARNKLGPRLLLGAVEVLSGSFEAFDSWCDPDAEPQDRRCISYEAVAASGTLPDLRRAQRIPDLKNSQGQEALFWDGLFSQNPPVREFACRTDSDDIPDEIWVIRINPEKRADEPTTLGMIEDRRNELAGNLSLYQELRSIEMVNKWIDRCATIADDKVADPPVKHLLTQFHAYKPIRIYLITMHQDKAELGVASKFDRSPEFVSAMRQHGAMRAGQFLPLWLSASPDLLQWPDGDALAKVDLRGGDRRD